MAGCQGRNSQLAPHGRLASNWRKYSASSALPWFVYQTPSEIRIQVSDRFSVPVRPEERIPTSEKPKAQTRRLHAPGATSHYLHATSLGPVPSSIRMVAG